MRSISFGLAIVMSCAGCTSVALRRHAVNQAATVSDLRYEEVVENLAILADQPGSLISFSIVAGGVAKLTDTVQGQTTTVWDHAVHGFSKETLTGVAKRSPDLQWTLAPVASKPQLEAIRYACLWQLYGPPPDDSEAMSLLRAPMYGEYNGYHVGAADQLRRIPPGWLHVGSKKDVPRCACYSAHSGHTYVWVTPDGMSSLSEFTLAILDIATLDPSALALQPPLVAVESEVDGPSPCIASWKSTRSMPAEQTYACINGKIIPGPIFVKTPPEVKDDPTKIGFSDAVEVTRTDPTPRNPP
jgi:hypothetical protein